MSRSLLTYIVLVGIMIFGILYGIQALELRNARMIITSTTTLGPGYFPSLLAIILVILCIINIIETYLKKSDEKVEISNLKVLIYSLVVIVLFILSWFNLGYFFINVFFFILILLLVYRTQKFTTRLVLKNSVIAGGITLSTYIIFKVLLNIRL